jgi:4-amino-4-deoxy-L-arabinose transferase-like glycosyltransferase
MAPGFASPLDFRRWFVLAAAVGIIVFFYRLGALPIILWDEARLAINAFEMYRDGFSLVVTFAGEPDHWNTKPPLLIWLMAGSISAFGPNEWAVRLPSALASLATLAIVFWFITKRLGSGVSGYLAAIILLCTPAYVHTHAARTGNYDPMLTLWTTTYLVAAYQYLHGAPAQRRRWLAILAVAIGLAFMTKTVQGLIFVPAVLIYAAMVGQLGSVLRRPSVYLYVAAIVAVCAGWYYVREAVDPGYFDAAKANDLLGRYASVVEEHRGGVLYYLIKRHAFTQAPALLIALYLAFFAQGEHRRLARFFGIVTAFYLALITSAETKLPWYGIPTLPLAAMLLAVGIDRAWHRYSSAANKKHVRDAHVIWLGMAAAVLAIGSNIAEVESGLTYSRSTSLDQYPWFLRSSAVAENDSQHLITVVDSGFQPDPGNWAAAALFYVEALQNQGRQIILQNADAPLPHQDGQIVACGPIIDQLRAAQQIDNPVIQGEHCGLFRARTPPRQ